MIGKVVMEKESMLYPVASAGAPSPGARYLIDCPGTRIMDPETLDRRKYETFLAVALPFALFLIHSLLLETGLSMKREYRLLIQEISPSDMDLFLNQE